MLQRQQGRQDLFRLAELAGVTKCPPEVQHGVERAGVRVPVDLPAGLQDYPGLLELVRLTAGHRPPTLSAGRRPYATARWMSSSETSVVW